MIRTVHKDCFAYQVSKAGHEGCKALKVLECHGGAFYKPKGAETDSTKSR